MTGPKLLVLDIETLYHIVGTYGLFNQFHSIDKILQAGQVLCWAAKFVGSKEVKFARHDEPHFLTAIHAMLDEADAVITYNGKSFDVPHLNREFLRNGMAPPSPFKHVDLFLTVKKQFNFPSNKLAYVAKELGIGEKTEHEGFPLWIKCAAGDKNAWAKMRKYNLQDVILTEKLYHKLLPWVSGLPNRALYGSSNNPVCPVCGSTHIQQRGYYRTNTQMYKRFQCQSCKAWGRSRFTEVAKEQRTSILTQAASS